MLTECDSYEDDRTPRWCKYCRHYEYDSWYPGERVCGNRDAADMYGLPVDTTDTCEEREADDDGI